MRPEFPENGFSLFKLNLFCSFGSSYGSSSRTTVRTRGKSVSTNVFRSQVCGKSVIVMGTAVVHSFSL